MTKTNISNIYLREDDDERPLPNNSQPSQNTSSSLMQENSIWVNDFSEASAREFVYNLFRLEANDSLPIIPIYIDSYGGNLDALLTMLNALASISKPVATICIGKAMSAGAFLLASGTPGLRYCSKFGRVMIHEVIVGLVSTAYQKTTEFKSMGDEIIRLNANILEIFAKKTNFKTITSLHAAFNKRNNADWYMAASEAKKHGIIDFINLPMLISEESHKNYKLIIPTVEPPIVKSKKAKKAKKAKAQSKSNSKSNSKHKGKNK